MQCNALTKSGNRCERVTGKPLCYQHISHLYFENLLKLRKSTIRLNLGNTYTILHIKNNPEATLTLAETTLSEIPQFEGTHTLIADNLRLQSISFIYSLIRLSLDNTTIKFIPNLPNLLYLSLQNTFDLQNLPSFPKLRNLYLQGSSIIVLSKLKELSVLDISETAISEIPAPKLRNLTANRCFNVSEITNQNLVYLSIRESKVKYLHHLTMIKFLEASKSKELLTLPYSQIQRLDISYCRKVLRIPNILSLQYVNAKGALSLIKVPKLYNVDINYTQCPFLKNTVNFGNLGLYNLSKIIKLQRFFRKYLHRKFKEINFAYTDLKDVIWKYLY